MSPNETERSAIVQRTMRQAERIAPEMGNAVVPVWCDGAADMQRMLIGTAFFAEREGRSHLITALHNFSSHPDRRLKIEFSDKLWTLNDMSARISLNDDLWVAEASSDLHECLRDIRVPLLLRDRPEECRFGTGSVLMGFPDDLNMHGAPFAALAISTTLETRSLCTASTLPEPLVFNVKDDFLTTAEGAVVMDRPDINGMSGGAVFSWYCVDAANSWEFRYFLQGMIVSWQRRDGYIVACNAARIATLLR